MNDITDMYSYLVDLYRPLTDMFWTVFNFILFSLFTAIIVYILYFFIYFRLNLFKPKLIRIYCKNSKFKSYNLIKWHLFDLLYCNAKYKKTGIRDKRFSEYGFTIYTGRQGSGKTISMVHYLNEMHKKYPECLIITNFKYRYATKQMTDWHDFMTIRNGIKGVIFAIDEIQNEYNTESWKTFPEELLSEICMQRKQCIKIVATSQVYSRVAKQIREQCFSVVCCNTYFKRWSRIREYDANEYGTSVDSPYTVKRKFKPINKYSYIQTNYLRRSYDTWEKIERLSKQVFIPRNER